MLGKTFTRLNFEVDTFEVVPADRVDDPYFDVEFPDPAGYDVIVPLGARWAVYDERLAQAWVGSEIKLIQQALDLGIGVLGVCFGGQLVAASLGGSVERSDFPEIGWRDVHSNNSTLVPAGPWFQWHFDRWVLPPAVTEIARNDCASQAFVKGTAMALQFHPELDQRVLDVWIAEDRNGDAEQLGVSAEALRARTATEIDDATRRLGLLVRGFIDNVVRNNAPTGS
jgi:GMP synthase-like glutamine amidotransferase